MSNSIEQAALLARYAKRYQVTEVPPIQPHTTGGPTHAVMCTCCGHRTPALPATSR